MLRSLLIAEIFGPPRFANADASMAAAWRPFAATKEMLPKWLRERRGEEEFSDLPIFEANVDLDETWAHQPFVLRGHGGVLEYQTAAEKLALLQASASSDVRVGYSWSIAQNRGEGPQKMSLEDYLQNGMDQGIYDNDIFLEPIYAFDMDLQLPGLPGFDDLPEAISSWKTYGFSPERVVTVSMLGAPRSAVGWHSHGASIQMTVHGRKRWFLYPPGQYPPGDGPGGGFSLSDWIQLVYPSLEDDQRPLECIVEAGDVVYVPDGWYHAVVNLADTVGVSIQSRDMKPEAQEAFKGLSLQMVQSMWEENPDTIEEIASAAREYLNQGLRNDLHARRVLYYCLMQRNQTEAIDVILEGVRKDPYHIPLQFELASSLARQLTTESGQNISEVREVMRALLEEWEPYLKANSRNQKAMWILNKFHRALGHEKIADTYFDRLVELNEKGIDR